jgi:hypothetical protein
MPDDELPRLEHGGPVVPHDKLPRYLPPPKFCEPGRVLHRKRRHLYFPDPKIPTLMTCSRCGAHRYLVSSLRWR